MVISSNSLFHFTNNTDNLIGILNDGFIPRYCLETLTFNGKKKSRAYPMVCFCDIPLSQIKNHINFYGYYGLGLSKEWGRKHKLNPVLYLDSDSLLNKHFIDMATQIWDAECFQKCEEKINILRSHYFHAIRYIKAYEGDFERGDKIYAKYRFYDEKEWRYVPEVKDITENSEESFYLSEENYKAKITRSTFNALLQKSHKLIFDSKDIEYLILNDKREALSMIKSLIKIKGKVYSDEDLDYLKTKIITVDQIKNDF